MKFKSFALGLMLCLISILTFGCASSLEDSVVGVYTIQKYVCSVGGSQYSYTLNEANSIIQAELPENATSKQQADFNIKLVNDVYKNLKLSFDKDFKLRSYNENDEVTSISDWALEESVIVVSTGIEGDVDTRYAFDKESLTITYSSESEGMRIELILKKQ